MSEGQSVTVSAELDGAAQITLANGKKTTIPKEPGQTGIREARIAPDGTVGWLAEYRVEGVGDPIAGTLIIWRAGNDPVPFLRKPLPPLLRTAGVLSMGCYRNGQELSRTTE
jgi:hypothetical protein